MTRVADQSLEGTLRRPLARLPASRRRNHVGTASLIAAVVGAVGCQIALRVGPFAGQEWLRLAAAGFEAATVGGLADWFAVTALFRHPLGIPIPHTALLHERRDKIVESIVSMVQDDWLAPDVILARLERVAPSTLVLDWISDAEHLERIGAPIRDVLRGVARMLTEGEVSEFVDRTLQRQLRDLPIDASAGRWLIELAESESADAAFEMMAASLANIADRPRTAAELGWWLDRSARTLREEGKRLVPMFLRRKIVQRKIVEAACGYASAELRHAASERDHPLRGLIRTALQRFGERLAGGDPTALEQVRQLRQAVLESLEAGPVIGEMLQRLRAQLEEDLDDPKSYLSGLVDRKLRAGILELLEDPERRASFDRWVRTTAHDLLRRHHHQIGLTVRENLEALDTDALVAQIEERVGDDLQFIRLNGAVVGGIIGILIALTHWLLG